MIVSAILVVVMIVTVVMATAARTVGVAMMVQVRPGDEHAAICRHGG